LGEQQICRAFGGCAGAPQYLGRTIDDCVAVALEFEGIAAEVWGLCCPEDICSLEDHKIAVGLEQHAEVTVDGWVAGCADVAEAVAKRERCAQGNTWAITHGTGPVTGHTRRALCRGRECCTRCWLWRGFHAYQITSGTVPFTTRGGRALGLSLKWSTKLVLGGGRGSSRSSCGTSRSGRWKNS
jgi:hypothetical protein